MLLRARVVSCACCARAGLNLDYILDNPWLVIPISSKDGTNIEQVGVGMEEPWEGARECA